MARITPYTRAPYPTIEGNDRVYFDNEFRKIQECIASLIHNLKQPYLINGGTAYVIASGVATIGEAAPTPISAAIIDTEAAAATDDLDTLNWTGAVDGQNLQISAANDARTVVLKDGTGNLSLSGDMSLDNTADIITLQYYNGNFFEIARSNNAA